MDDLVFNCHRCGDKSTDPKGWWRVEEERIVYDAEHPINKKRTYCKRCYRAYLFFASGATVVEEDDGR